MTQKASSRGNGIIHIVTENLTTRIRLISRRSGFQRF